MACTVLALLAVFQAIIIILLQVNIYDNCISNKLTVFISAVTLGPPNETIGEAKGFTLIYSGNFLIEAELTEMGRLRFNMGIHPMGMQWHLKFGKFLFLCFRN
jgi:hypothetical protein